MPASLTSHLLAALPESIWAEANRRLRLVPELLKLAQDGSVYEAFTALGGDPLNWRPGPLALAVYAARHPECAGNAEAWLAGAGRERVNAAYAQLVNPTAILNPLDDCLPAALALRLRGYATTDWAAIAADAAAQPDQWHLPLQYLWGLLESPTDLFTALMKLNPTGAELAAQCLAVNCQAAEAAGFVMRLKLAVPTAHWLAFTHTLKNMGELELAQTIAKSALHSIHTPTHAHTLSTNPDIHLADFDAALLLAATGDFALAHPILKSAWEQAKKLSATLSTHIGQLALLANDPVIALAGFQDALPVEPNNPELRAGLAKALLMLNQPDAALATIGASTTDDPAALLVAARAHWALGQRAEVLEMLKRLSSDDHCPPALLAEAAQVYFELDDLSNAIRFMKLAAETARTDPEKYLAAARWLIASSQWEDGRAMATEAAALAPQSADARELLAGALLECGDPVGAVRHFQAAVVFDPARASASLGLARAALAAGQPALTRDAAQQVLASSPEAIIEGEAHVLMGQALSALGQDDQAFEHFSRASTLVPAAPEPWRAMAQHALQRGDVDRAIATLEAGRQALSLAASPHIAPLLTDLAQIYISVGRATEAISALREACTVNSHSPREHRLLGSLLRKQGFTAEAVEVLRRSLQMQPGDASTLHEWGLALEKLGRPDEAWAAYQQSGLARPQTPEPYFDLGRLTLSQVQKGVPNASPLQASAALREAVRLAPEDAEAHALFAQAQQLAGQPEGALDSYQRALHLAPARTDWSLGLGQVCLALHRPEAAIAVLQEALKHAPETQLAAVYHALACAYAQSNLWPEAFQSVEAALRTDPENPALFELQAEAYERLGVPDEAVKSWQQAVALNPRDTQMQIRYARCLLNLGRADEARGVYAQALSIGPDSAEVHLAAGRALLELGEVEQAYQLLAQATDLAPQSAAAHAAFGEAALRAQKYEAAHAAFLRAADLEPETAARATYLREAGEALWKMNRTAAAIVLWQRAISLNPKDPLTLARLGMALARLGQFAEALAALEKALQHNPKDAATLREAARAAVALDEYDKAARYLEGVINLTPGDAEARYLLGQVHEHRNETDKALGLYRQAARLSPGEGRYLAASADTLARLGEMTEAVKFIESALSASPDSPDVQQRAGDIYLKAGRTEAAAQAFVQLVAARPHDATAHLSFAQALVVLAEEREHEERAGLPAQSKETQSAASSGSSAPAVDQELQQAAALGADPQAVRYWMGRAKAVNGDPQEAQRLLESIAASPSAKSVQPVDLYRALGSALRKSGQPERAREALQAALEQQKSVASEIGDTVTQRATQLAQAKTYLELGLIHAALGDPRGAVVAFKRAAAAAPEWPIAHYHLAEGLLALGDRHESAQVMQRAVALKPDAASWHHRLAKIYRAGREATALAHFQRAAELDPVNPDYAADLARVLAKDGDLTTAAEYFRRATEANGGDAALWTERGQTHLSLADLNAAAACFARAAQLDPANAAAHLGGARVSLALGDLHDAANKAEAAARLAPNNTDTLICLADVQAAQGDSAAAESSYSAAAAKAQDPAPALFALGRLHYAQGKLEKAIGPLERAAAANPEADEIFALLGDVRHSAGDYPAALTAYREAVHLSPRNPKHLLRLGRACRAQGQLDQALSHLLQAREVAPGDDEVLREAGLVFEHRKQYDRALEMYQFAIKAAPHTSINHTRVGATLKQLKDYAGAVSALERAVALDPKNLEATKQLAVVSALNLMHGEPRVRV